MRATAGPETNRIEKGVETKPTMLRMVHASHAKGRSPTNASLSRAVAFLYPTVRARTQTVMKNPETGAK